MTLAHDEWASLLSNLEEPAVGQVAEALAGARDLNIETAYNHVEDALANGHLEEEDDGGWGTVRVVDTDETPDTRASSDEDDESGEGGASGDVAQAALTDAIEWFHARLDDTIEDHTKNGEHPERPTTAREWFEDVRGFDTATIDEKRLGWVPADSTDQLVAYLHRRGHTREAMLATGLFTEDLRLLWHGRYVFPYYDRADNVAYAIARCTGGKGGGDAGYDGHPRDFLAGKYTKLAHTKDFVTVSEPIYGVGSLGRDGPVLITEGVADAIRAHEAGYACLSPVTTQFKHEHREQLLKELDGTGRRVYVIQDAERPKSEYTDEGEGWDALGLEQTAPGLKGAITTAAFLNDGNIDARLAELPRPGVDKVDLDDYLGEWSDTLRPVLASARPAEQHPAYQEATNSTQRSGRNRDDWGDRDGSDHDHDDLTREQVEEALGYVNNTLHYDDWIQLGYAIHDWDDGPVGKDVFESWSRASPKWEEPASQNAIDWIWENATAGGETTVATLVHRAVKGGWSPPRPNSDKGRLGFDPREKNITVDPREAWAAASAVTPGDLDENLDLTSSGDDDGWKCPRCGEAVSDVVRAVGVAEGYLNACSDALEGCDYHDLYEVARSDYGAPLPEYVPTSTVTDDLGLATSAVGALRGWHIADSLESECTVTDPSGGDARAVFDPIWEDSKSGERIVLFNSGLFWCREHEVTIDPLRVVALEQDLIAHETAPLQSETFLQAYRIARTQYGAPLPEISWNGRGDDEMVVDQVPVLPSADDLLGEGITTDEDGLNDARQDVEELYRDLADGANESHLMTVLPALGKTTSVVKNAPEFPALYLSGRRELMAEVAEKAEDFGASTMHLPVLSEKRPPEEATQAATSRVRDLGKGLLRDREELADGLTLEKEEENVDVDEDEVHLDRGTCATAEGDHGDEWQLAVHVARSLGHSPREIHVLDESLFGEEVPCQHDGNCEYSQSWERATDPDAPVDLLIGHYVHGHVPGARKYVTRGEDDQMEVDQRVVAVDEFPGDAYSREFGEEFLDHARWLASSLCGDIETRQDLTENRQSLWEDDWIASWINGEAETTASHKLQAVRNISEAAGAASDARERIENERMEDALNAVAELSEDLTGFEAARENLLEAIAMERRSLNRRFVERVTDEIERPLSSAADTVEEYGSLTDIGDDQHLSGDLETLVERTVDAVLQDGLHEHRDLLKATLNALQGGRSGAEALAAGADDGYAHPAAFWLLPAFLAPDETDSVEWHDGAKVSTDVIETDDFSYGGFDGATVKSYREAGVRTLIDLDHGGATVHHPPEFGMNTVVGLDATGEVRMWELALCEEMDRQDIHAGNRERREFLRDVMNLQVVQTSPHVNSWEGDPSGKNLDKPVALVEAIANEFGECQLRQDRLTSTTKPGVITTKCVREILEDDLKDSGADVVDNYGNVIGSNALGEHNVGAVLGCQHYGDAAVQKWAALAGESVEREGYGTNLEYNSVVANAYLRRMREDKTMQAILRFGRDEEGAIVFAHTAALRDDLPVVGEAAVVNAYSETARAVAESAASIRGGFTARDILERADIDVSKRQVRRVLNEYVNRGYLHRRSAEPGLANEYEMADEPGAGEVELPSDVDLESIGEPGSGALENTNTGYVWVTAPNVDLGRTTSATTPHLPAPIDDMGGVSGPPSS